MDHWIAILVLPAVLLAGACDLSPAGKASYDAEAGCEPGRGRFPLRRRLADFPARGRPVGLGLVGSSGGHGTASIPDCYACRI